MSKIISGPGDDYGLAAQLVRFPYPARNQLEVCAELSDRVGQLAITFPFLFFAIATGYGPFVDRKAAVLAAADGRPLRDVASAMSLPMCFRKIEPEACQRRPMAARWSAGASRQLAPHVPTEANVAARWLSGVSYAHLACDEVFALWVARQHDMFIRSPIALEWLIPVAAYVRQSRQTIPMLQPHDPAPWSPDWGLPKTLESARHWLDTIALARAEAKAWACEAVVPVSSWLGYDFIPLLTPEDLAEEADAMRNCLRTYAIHVRTGRCFLFSVRWRGARIATLEARRGAGRDKLVLVQIKGPANRNCPLEAHRAAEEWLSELRVSIARRPSSARKQLAMPAPANDIPVARWRQGLRGFMRQLGLKEGRG